MSNVRWAAAVLLALLLGFATPAAALTWGTFGDWDSQARRDAADASMQAVVNRFNAYGDFNWGSDGYVDVYYNAGVPTANASYYGAITFGGTWPNERVSQHELNHWLGSGTDGRWYELFNGQGAWTGHKVNQLYAQFDGEGAVMRQSGVHFYPYGLNYDTEVTDASVYMRNVAIMYAQRQDMGNGNPNDPWSATSATLVGSDPVGTSAFNWMGGGLSGSYPGWSDKYFAHQGATYSTAAFDIRTPQGTPSWSFAGDSLTVNSGGRLLYNGWGTSGIVRIPKLIVAGGTVRHDQFAQDHFQLAANVTLSGTSTFDAGQGNITVSGNVGGTGTLTKTGSHVLTLTGTSTYSGSTNIQQGTLRLGATAPIASYSFDNVAGSTVLNTGTGGEAMNGTLAGGASTVSGGKFGRAVSLSGGASVDINNPITNLDNDGNWTVSAWVKTSTPGGSLLSKGDGAGWGYGNTIFYLGDGTAGGSGGIPSAVRWAGGFLQGSTTAASVTDNSWHQVTYVNNGGAYSIYVDGTPQPLSAVNNMFNNADIGSVLRLGVSTNNVPADGTVNFNGLLDDVQFYGQALTAAQVNELHQGRPISGSLPSTSNVSIASGAALDLNGTKQQIGSLSGVSGSRIDLRGGELVVNSIASSQFDGLVTGFAGNLTKQGSGTLTLSGNHRYTGTTRVESGTLRLVGSAFIPQSRLVDIAGGTLDVSSLGSTFTVRDEQWLSNTSEVLGNVNASSGAVLAGAGVFTGNLTVSSGALVRVEAIQAPSLAVRNGGFEAGINPPGESNVDYWFDTDTTAGSNVWWANSQHEQNLSPTADTGVLLGDGDGTTGGPNGVGGRWIYQQVGTLAAGEEYRVSFDYGLDLGSSANRAASVRIEVLQGTFTRATDNNDILDEGLTLITSMNTPSTSLLGEGRYATFASSLDLSSANHSEPLWLRISNLPGAGADRGSWVVVDNVDLRRTTTADTAGGVMTVEGDLTMAQGSVLEVTLGASGHDFINVAETATLAGTLHIRFEDGFTPSLGDTFTILSASELTHQLLLTSPNGVEFSLSQTTSTSLILTAVSGLDGDYNNDGVVNLADYTVWRDHLGASAGTLLNDSHMGPIGIERYIQWRSNFGLAMDAVRVGGASPVPEPPALSFFAFASFLASRRLCRRVFAAVNEPQDA